MDESNGFTQYGLVPSGPLNLSKRLGNMSLSVLGDLTNRVLKGDVAYEGQYGSVGASRDLAGTSTNLRGSYYTPEGELSASGTVNGVNNVNYSTGPYNMGTDTKGNYYGSYQGDGFQVNATDKSLDTSFQIPMVDKSNTMSAGAGYDSYSKTPEVYGQFHRQLSDNGFVDASGRLTPKGYELMLQGGFSF
jgi:hypothetical protein